MSDGPVVHPGAMELVWKQHGLAKEMYMLVLAQMHRITSSSAQAKHFQATLTSKAKRLLDGYSLRRCGQVAEMRMHHSLVQLMEGRRHRDPHSKVGRRIDLDYCTPLLGWSWYIQ